MKKFIGLSILSIAIASLTSCLKEGSRNIDPNGSPSVVEWSTNLLAGPNNTLGGYTAYTTTYTLAPTATVPLVIDYAGSGEAPEDITVTIGTNPAALAAYKTAGGSSYNSYTELPASFYTMPATVVIPKGQRKVSVPVVVKLPDLGFTIPYILPISIKQTTSGGISGNYGTILVRVGVRNIYDGVYKYKSSANQTLLPNRSASVNLVTVDADRVTLNLAANYTNQVIVYINPTTKKATVEDSGGIGAATTDPSSAYDPATKTLTLKWNTSNRVFEEVYTFDHAR